MRWYSPKAVISRNTPFNIVIGGRGIGKTYGFLLEEYNTHHSSDRKFIYLRTRQSELDICCTPEGNPFKAINEDKCLDVTVKKLDKIALLQEVENTIGYGIALSTFGNLRGVDFSDVDDIIYEEFNTVSGQRLKNQFILFFNLYETVNRNRELKGRPPVKVYMLSNSTSLDNDILVELDLITIIENMMKKRWELWSDPEHIITVNLVLDSDISAAKAETVAYKLTRNSSFYNQAIRNEFTEDSWYNVKKRPLTEYRPWCRIDDVTIYMHKSNGMMYAAMSKADCPVYSSTDNYAYFIRNFGMALTEKIGAGRVEFSDYTTKLKLLKSLRII